MCQTQHKSQLQELSQYGRTQPGRKAVCSAATWNSRAALPPEQQRPLTALSTEPFHPHPHCPALHSPKAGENTGCIFLLFSTQMAAKSSRARMKIKTPLQKVTQDNISQPSSHVLSVQSSSEAPTVHLKCCCVTNQGTKGHLIPSHQQL